MACHMTSSVLMVVLVSIAVLFTLTGYALVRVGDDSSQSSYAEKMHLLYIKNSTCSTEKVLRRVRQSVKSYAKNGKHETYLYAGTFYINCTKTCVLSIPQLKEVESSLRNEGFNVEWCNSSTIKISW